MEDHIKPMDAASPRRGRQTAKPPPVDERSLRKLYADREALFPSYKMVQPAAQRSSSSSSSSNDLKNADKEQASSNGDEEFEATTTRTSSSYNFSASSTFQDEDFDLEEPTTLLHHADNNHNNNNNTSNSNSNSNAPTNHAVCSRQSQQQGRRRRQVKPQTPREQWCCCGGYGNTNDNLDYDYDDDYGNYNHNDYEYDNDASSCGTTRMLRYCRLLPPRPNEHPIKKKIRHVLWWTILLDLVVALISVFSFGGQQHLLLCCGKPILAVPGLKNNDVHQAIQIVMYTYLGVVMAQILPVVREGCIPWNLMNPIFGFVLGFVLFLNDDAPLAALCIWILQIISVALEFVAYRHYSILHRESKKRLDRANHKAQGVAKAPKRDYYHQNKSERLRRELQSRHKKSLYRLRKHFIGVFINILLSIATLMLIIYVAKQGGMCVKDGGTPSLFLFDEEMECNSSEGKRYATCDSDSGESECYFPFF